MHLCFWPIVLGACWYLWGLKLNPFVWFFFSRPGISSCHVFISWFSRGGRHLKVLLHLSRPELVLRFPNENLFIFPLLKSLNSGVPVHTYLLVLYLKLLRWVWGILSFMCGCRCCISAKIIHSSLLSWRYPYFIKLKDQIQNSQNRRSGEKSNCIYETFKNTVMPHGRQVYAKASDLEKA